MHCRCRSKDCSDIRWIHHVFQNGNPVLSLAKFPEIFQWSAFQCTKHSSRQLKSCQLRKDSKLCCKNRSACILKSCKNFLRLFIFFHLFLFNQNRYWIYPASNARPITFGLSAIKSPSSGQSLFRSCASV